MPYNLKERRPELDKNPLKAQDAGDLTYIFAKWFWTEWNKKDAQRWGTYHKFRVLLKNPGANTEFESLTSRLGTLLQFTRLDVSVAAELALDEFFRRVMVKYEQGKIQANGDVFTNVVIEPAKAEAK